MPLYEYRCRGCRHEFEQLVRTGDTARCPRCESRDLERLLSTVRVSTDQTRQSAFQKATAAADKVRNDKERAHQEYVKSHHDERRE